ncbi:major facilitator superfamily domain-containing protein [Pseudomassariella vexata]|uniref:Major facilitator superfamily domain-containing protein n=1 Tax=Pseudomassariella vexata TaxID=1141098 RepID=A0A1Y2DCX9_9PEZI|nr:major facilitator superfamily domain-containing protein [Pseudomassariella vexata]ORY57132.1 major facilitator superfamily domain-containing protein [Pseudomassariella vexata]
MEFNEPLPAQGQNSGGQDAEKTPQSDDSDPVGINTTPKKGKKSLAVYVSFFGITVDAFVFSLDVTTLAVALPSIAKQLYGTTLQSFWASIVYLLCVVITQPLYTAGFLMFTLGSTGLGGGGMDLMAEVIVADLTKERSLYLGLLALPTAIGSILGPALSALFSTYVSWRWIGWINLPLPVVSFFLVVFFLRLRPVDASIMAKLKRLDWGGILLSFVGIMVFVVPLSWANALHPWAFPLRLFHSKTVNLTILANFIHGVSLYSLLQYLPLFYQAVKLDTPVGSAITLLPTSVLSVVFAVVGVILTRPPLYFFGLPILWGVAIGALMRLLHLPIQASVADIKHTGLATGLLLLIRLMGGVVGLALGSTIFNSVFASSIINLELPGSLTILQDASQAIGFIPPIWLIPRDTVGT